MEGGDYMQKYFTFMIVAVGMLLTGCKEKPVVNLSQATIVGIYKGTYGSGSTESFAIKADGTFTQSLSKNNSLLYSNVGNWHIDQAGIVFQNIYLANDVWHLNQGKPALVDSFRAHWNPRVPTIVFSDEQQFWVVRQNEAVTK
jgi:hypothetical protein